jgi:hypothetical protein
LATRELKTIGTLAGEVWNMTKNPDGNIYFGTSNSPLAADGKFYEHIYKINKDRSSITRLDSFENIEQTTTCTFADGTGKVTVTMNPAIGLLDNDVVYITDSAHFNGTYTIDYKDADEFHINTTWVSQAGETGTVHIRSVSPLRPGDYSGLLNSNVITFKTKPEFNNPIYFDLFNGGLITNKTAPTLINAELTNISAGKTFANVAVTDHTNTGNPTLGASLTIAQDATVAPKDNARCTILLSGATRIDYTASVGTRSYLSYTATLSGNRVYGQSIVSYCYSNQGGARLFSDIAYLNKNLVNSGDSVTVCHPVMVPANAPDASNAVYLDFYMNFGHGSETTSITMPNIVISNLKWVVQPSTFSVPYFVN